MIHFQILKNIGWHNDEKGLEEFHEVLQQTSPLRREVFEEVTLPPID